VPRPWDPPETEFPAIVPISTLQFGRSAQTAIAITGMSAYSNGFEIFVTRLIRPDAPGFDQDPVPGAPRGMLAERQSFQISLQLSDGRMVTSGRHYGDAEPAGPILRSRGGGGTSHYLPSRPRGAARMCSGASPAVRRRPVSARHRRWSSTR
jgi:hypothetical protein